MNRSERQNEGSKVTGKKSIDPPRVIEQRHHHVIDDYYRQTYYPKVSKHIAIHLVTL